MDTLQIKLDSSALQTAIAGAILGQISQEDQMRAIEAALKHMLGRDDWTTTVMTRAVDNAVKEIMVEWARDYVRNSPEFRALFDKIAAKALRELVKENKRAVNSIASALAKEIGYALDEE